MDALTLANLAKIAKPAVNVAVSGPAKNLARPFRVAHATAREAKRANIKITARTVRHWLRSDATRTLFKGYSDAALETVVSRLAWMAPGATAAAREANTATVVGMILRNYLRYSAPAEATGQSFAWLDQRIATLHTELTAVRADVNAAADRVVARIDAGSAFADAVMSLAPVYSEQATALRGIWPAVEQAAVQLADPDTRQEVLEQWSAHEPEFLDNAPADAYAWLGSLATDADAHGAGIRFLEQAVAIGVHPRGFYIAKIAAILADSDAEKARAYLNTHDDVHPLHVAVTHSLDQDLAGARDALTEWKPVEREQVAYRGVMLARVLAELGERNEAIAVALDTHSETASGTAALLAAQLLVERAARRQSVTRGADTRQAVDLALRVRDTRKKWGGDSAEAVEIAVGGILVEGDAERAWRLTQLPPDGDATPREANDGRVRRSAALIAAMTGRSARARELASSLGDAYDLAEVEALLAEDDGDGEGARQCWRSAWDHARHSGEKLYSAMAIARLGGALPDLTDLRSRYPEPVGEIELVAQVLGAADPMASLRANLYGSRLFVSELAGRYHADGNDAQAAATYADGARHWSDPNLMLIAASTYRSAGMPSEAAQCAEEALDLGGSDWSGIRDAIGLIIEIEAARRHWNEAVGAARRLVAAAPGDVQAVWVLVRCQLHAGDLAAAWATLTSRGAPLKPTSREEILAWLQLNTRFAADAAFLDQALELMRDRIEDEELFGAFLIMAYLPQTRFEPTPSQLAELHRVTNEYVQRHPDSQTFYTVQMGPDENPLEFVEEDLRARYEATRELYERVAAGALPLGILSSAVSKPYLEASLRRAAGRVLAEESPRPAEDDASAVRAAAEPVVLDPTAAHTLALLDESMRTALMGQAHTLLATDVAYRDVVQARDVLMLRSTGTIGWDPTLDRPTATEISSEDADRLAELANRVVDIYQNVARRTYPELKHFGPGETQRFAWLSSIDMAKERGQILWTDDRTLRRLARSMGIPAFGTLALIDRLAVERKISAAEKDVAVATLLTNYYADLGFNITTFRLGATMDVWQARGIAAALARPSSWADPAATINFTLSAIAQCAATAPDQVQGWALATAFGLLAIASDNPVGATKNLELFLARCAVEPWFGPHTLPYVVSGIREARRQSETDTRDPLEAVLRSLHRAAVQANGHPAAAAYVLGLTAQAVDADKAMAARIILTAEE
jgi:tetratricopeptide (TPR) repeat protein